MKKYYKEIYTYKTFIQPKLTENGTWNGDTMAVKCTPAITSTNRKPLYTLFDGNSTVSSYTGVLSSQYWTIYIYLPTPIQVNSVTVVNHAQPYTNPGYGITHFDVLISNNETSWEKIGGVNTGNGSSDGASYTATCSTERYCQYIQIKTTASSINGYQAHLNEITINGIERTKSIIEVPEAPKYTTKYYKNSTETFNQPTMTDNEIMGGETFAVSASSERYESSLSQTFYAYLAMDGSTAVHNCWSSVYETGNTFYCLYNPEPIKITKFTFLNYNSTSDTYTYASTAGKIQVSNDGNTWTTIQTYTNSATANAGIWNIDLGNNAVYSKYYRIYSTTDSSSYGWIIARLTLTANTAQEVLVPQENPKNYDFTIKTENWTYCIGTKTYKISENENIFRAEKNKKLIYKAQNTDLESSLNETHTLLIVTDPIEADCTLTHNDKTYNTKALKVPTNSIIQYKISHNTYGTFEDQILMDTDKTITLTGQYTSEQKEVAWSQPILTSNGTLGSGKFAVASSKEYKNSNYYTFHAFDGKTGNKGYSGCFGGGGSCYVDNYYWTFWTSDAIKIKSIKVLNRTVEHTAFKNMKFYRGSSTSSWTQEGSYKNTQQDANKSWSCSWGGSGFAKYHKFLVVDAGALQAYSCGCQEMYITATKMTSSGSYYWDVEIT